MKTQRSSQTQMLLYQDEQREAAGDRYTMWGGWRNKNHFHKVSWPSLPIEECFILLVKEGIFHMRMLVSYFQEEKGWLECPSYLCCFSRVFNCKTVRMPEHHMLGLGVLNIFKVILKIILAMCSCFVWVDHSLPPVTCKGALIPVLLRKKLGVGGNVVSARATLLVRGGSWLGGRSPGRPGQSLTARLCWVSALPGPVNCHYQ